MFFRESCNIICEHPVKFLKFIRIWAFDFSVLLSKFGFYNFNESFSFLSKGFVRKIKINCIGIKILSIAAMVTLILTRGRNVHQEEDEDDS
ncbi:hypothetical protein MIMGU_mgv1a017171mg [Erythranthe guttata]|uniref:Uncharacterized protein n=1 Tax=Erythranthe guttata TaxID=4155 RepID=A0A022Q558_ERYGU|nr:hypothetical protein MIMGU_mgv1a017171mg [Erythranthe guttata]